MLSERICKNALLDSQMLFLDNSAKNATFRIFGHNCTHYFQLYGSTYHRYEIIFGGHYNHQIRYQPFLITLRIGDNTPRKITRHKLKASRQICNTHTQLNAFQEI